MTSARYLNRCHLARPPKGKQNVPGGLRVVPLDLQDSHPGPICSLCCHPSCDLADLLARAPMLLLDARTTSRDIMAAPPKFSFTMDLPKGGYRHVSGRSRSCHFFCSQYPWVESMDALLGGSPTKGRVFGRHSPDTPMHRTDLRSPGGYSSYRSPDYGMDAPMGGPALCAP